MQSFHAKHYKEKPFQGHNTCCNPWRNILNHPFPDNAAILVVDVRNDEGFISIIRTEYHGKPIDLRIEPTHWMELGDICRPGGRKCRFVSPEEKEEREHFRLKDFYGFMASWIMKIGIVVLVAFLLAITIPWIFKLGICKEIGIRLVDAIQLFKGL